MNFTDVVPRDDRIDVHFEPASKLRLEKAKNPRALDGFVEVTGDASHRVVVILQSIQCDIDVKLKLWMRF